MPIHHHSTETIRATWPAPCGHGTKEPSNRRREEKEAEEEWVVGDFGCRPAAVEKKRERSREGGGLDALHRRIERKSGEIGAR